MGQVLRNRVLALVGLLCAGICFSDIANSQQREERENWLAASVYARPTLVDNANAASQGQQREDEVQTSYGASVSSYWYSELSAINVDYRYTQTPNNVASGTTQSYWEGDSQLILGNESTFYGFFAEHSGRQVLSNPNDSPIVISNIRSRQITTLSPSLRAHLGQATSIAAVYNYMDVSFDDTTSNDSERTGVDLVLRREVSPTRVLTLTLGEREIDYLAPESDIADYNTTSVTVGLDVERRAFDYSLSLGAVDVEPVFLDESITRLTVDFLFNTQVSANQFALFARRYITDSSAGNGNSDFFTSEVSFDGSLANADQVERTGLGLSWTHSLLCDRCNSSLSTGFERSDYLISTQSDSDQTFVAAGLGYQFSPRFSGSINIRQTETSFANQTALNSDTTNTRSQVAFSYQANRYLDFVLTHERDERNSVRLGDSVVNSTSLQITLSYE